MGRGRVFSLVGVIFAAFAAAAAVAGPSAARADPQPVGGRVGTHEGVASCSGSTCHSRPVASGLVVRQNELITWQDPHSDAGAHSRAWRVLTQPRAQAIVQRMGIAGPAQSAPVCLGCHADPAPAAQRGARFQLSDGVGCEACHGGSGGWIASHYAVGATHAANVKRGMVALDDPKTRAARCLDCHLGAAGPNQFVTHQIMAAGHPRIGFELDLFTVLQKHHDVDADYLSRHKENPGGVKTWAVGQALALDRALTLYGVKTPPGAFPEFVFFDCQSCHRTISQDPKAKLTVEPNPARPIPLGAPPFNDENMIMLSAAAKVAAPALSARFEEESRAFHIALAKNGSVAGQQAGRLAETSRKLADAFAARSFSRSETLSIFQAVLSGEAARYTDYAGAAQAVMGADTLLNALVAQGELDRGAAARLRPDLDRAYQAVRDANSFRPAEVRAALQAAAAKARGLK